MDESLKQSLDVHFGYRLGKNLTVGIGMAEACENIKSCISQRRGLWWWSSGVLSCDLDRYERGNSLSRIYKI